MDENTREEGLWLTKPLQDEHGLDTESERQVVGVTGSGIQGKRYFLKETSV